MSRKPGTSAAHTVLNLFSHGVVRTSAYPALWDDPFLRFPPHCLVYVLSWHRAADHAYIHDKNDRKAFGSWHDAFAVVVTDQRALHAEDCSLVRPRMNESLSEDIGLGSDTDISNCSACEPREEVEVPANKDDFAFGNWCIL